MKNILNCNGKNKKVAHKALREVRVKRYQTLTKEQDYDPRKLYRKSSGCSNRLSGIPKDFLFRQP